MILIREEEHLHGVKNNINSKRSNKKQVDALKKMKGDMSKILEEHINSKSTKQDDPMDETAASSFSPPPPQPPGAPRISKTERRNIRRAEKEAEPPLMIRDRSRSRNPEPIIEEPKKEKEKTRGGEYIGKRNPIKKSIDKRRAIKEPPIILKPSDEEEIKNSQPGRPKPSDEPKRRGRSVEVRPATSGTRKDEVKPEPEKIKAIEDKKDRSRSKPRGEPVRKTKAEKADAAAEARITAKAEANAAAKARVEALSKAKEAAEEAKAVAKAEAAAAAKLKAEEKRKIKIEGKTKDEENKSELAKLKPLPVKRRQRSKSTDVDNVFKPPIDKTFKPPDESPVKRRLRAKSTDVEKYLNHLMNLPLKDD